MHNFHLLMKTVNLSKFNVGANEELEWTEDSRDVSNDFPKFVEHLKIQTYFTDLTEVPTR